MSGRRRARLAIVALAAFLALVPGARAADAPLLPDLQPLPLERGSTIGLYPSGSQIVLDVGFQAANLGPGPLALEPLAEPPASDPAADCDGDGDPANDRPEQQDVFLDADGNGVFDPAIDTQTVARVDGCSIFHPLHNHWHAAVISTDLYAASSAQRVGGLDKLTFCLGDVGVFDEAIPGWSSVPGYPPANCSSEATQGISTGWYDQYRVALAGQQIDVTALAPGDYCVSQRVDASESIDENDELNNSVQTLISIDPPAGELAVLGSDCAARGEPAVDTTPPQTEFARTPRARLRTQHRRVAAQFGFAPSEPGVTVSCSKDGGPFRACESPAQAGLRARRGRWTAHTFAIRATDAAGNVDQTPAVWRGTVRRVGAHRAPRVA